MLDETTKTESAPEGDVAVWTCAEAPESATQTINQLNDLVGKKLVWAGYDSSAEGFALLFQDDNKNLSGLFMTDACRIANAQDFVGKFLDENLAAAQSVVALQQFKAPDAPTTAPAPAQSQNVVVEVTDGISVGEPKGEGA